MSAKAVAIIGGSLALAASVWIAPLSANRNFAPDWTFMGSTLAEWQSLGEADWTSSAGEIVGTPKSEGGGWLLLNKSYQDVQMAATFRCTGGCKAGVLVRAEKTPAGYKGVFVSLGSTSAAFAVTLDPQGRELTRQPLAPGGGFVRFLPPPPTTGGAGAPAAAPAATTPARGPAPPPALPQGAPYRRPVYDYKPDDWNTLEVVMDANILRVWINDGPEPGVAGGRADDTAGRYGPVALYVGGTGEVRYKTIETKDLGRRVSSPEQIGSRFRMQQLTEFYYAWSATAADINKDGVLDVIAGPFYYLGPDYSVSREIYLGQPSNPSTQYTPAMLNFAYDYTNDGYPDVLVTEGRNFVMYVNPGTELRRWDRYPAFNNGSESVTFRDLTGDGKPEAIILNSGMVSFARANNVNPTEPWIVRAISGPGYGTNAQHGIGAGDINGDGRIDIVHPYGWWEQPATDMDTRLWPFHPAQLGSWPRAGASPGGGEMMVYDVNGDKLNDVVTSLQGHGWGLAWYEQVRDDKDQIAFAEHVVMDGYDKTDNAGKVAFSEPHGTTAADIDGDGIMDFVVGKRSFAHNESYIDPDPYGEPVLYWYRTVRTNKNLDGAELVPELIHNRSGVGSAVSAIDLNKDGAVDILTATNRGTFIFWNTPKSAAPKPAAPATSAPARGRGTPTPAAPAGRGRQ